MTVVLKLLIKVVSVTTELQLSNIVVTADFSQKSYHIHKIHKNEELEMLMLKLRNSGNYGLITDIN